jgi:Tol biopolymer transport system component/DNA-binding winged helix-turn-helix (wHTH) protein
MTRKITVSEYRFADVAIDTADFRVRKAGEPQKITPRAFEVLLYLIENRGRTVEKQEIFEQIWHEQFVSDNALTRIIKEIRQVIGDAAGAPRFIETVPKRGYRFIAEVEAGVVPEEIQTASNRHDPALEKIDAAPPVANPQRSNYLIFTILLLVGAFISVGGWLFLTAWNSEGAPVVARTAQITRGSGLDNFPAISPDGNLLAYSSDQNGSFEIYVKSLATDAKEIQITADGNQNFQPAFSPDASRLAFHSKGRGGIWVVPVSGGTARQLTTFGTNPAWSPDGKQIAFQSGALTSINAFSRTLPPSVLWLVASDGGEPVQLTGAGNPVGGHSSPAWSPDGRRIAFNVEDFQSFGIWSVQIADGKLQEISSNGFDPVYAPDGKRIFYVSLNGLWQLPILPGSDQPAGTPVQISDDGPAQIRHLKISADGKKIVYGMLQSKSGIASVAVNAATGEAVGNPVSILQNSAPRNTFPAFSPDGSRFVHVLWQAGSIGALWLTNADGQNSTELTQNGGVPSWFPDGERIAFMSNRDGVLKVWSINILNGRTAPIYTFASDVDFMKLSPDGKTIAFNSKADGTINVWLANLESGEQRQLTFHTEFAGFPIWSPDGKTLAVQIKRGEDTHVALVSATDGETLQLTDERGQSWIHSFSPDGERIAFAGQRDDLWNIYAVSRTTKEQKKLTKYDKLNSFVRYPAWSPRGDKIIFEYTETPGNIWLTELK